MMLRVGPFLIITKGSFYDQMVRWWTSAREERDETAEQIQYRQDYDMSLLELFRRFIFR